MAASAQSRSGTYDLVRSTTEFGRARVLPAVQRSRPQSGRSAGAFPQARVLALCETGTHVIWKHLIKPIRCGEVTMAPTLLRHLHKNMLLMWDRNFLSYANVALVQQ